jgi:hypothetical protein
VEILKVGDREEAEQGTNVGVITLCVFGVTLRRYAGASFDEVPDTPV